MLSITIMNFNKKKSFANKNNVKNFIAFIALPGNFC